MVKVLVKIKGLADARANIRQVLQNIEVGTEAGLDVVAASTLSDDKATIAVDTGHLRDNQQVYKARLDRQVGSDVPYHIFVELGTYKMPARPAVTNAFEANQATLVPNLLKMKVL